MYREEELVMCKPLDLQGLTGEIKLPFVEADALAKMGKLTILRSAHEPVDAPAAPVWTAPPMRLREDNVTTPSASA